MGKKDGKVKDTSAVVVMFSKKCSKNQEEQKKADFLIQPEKVTPTLDTSQWPLLLKVGLFLDFRDGPELR